jgi:hypothetical protein
MNTERKKFLCGPVVLSILIPGDDSSLHGLYYRRFGDPCCLCLRLEDSGSQNLRTVAK